MQHDGSVSIELRVPYADTDQMGVVYYANYLVYFERGRTEWLRNKGLTYKDLEAQGLYLPVAHATCTYLVPVRYDDLVTIRASVASFGAASVEFRCEVMRGTTVLAHGITKHPFVNASFKPVRIPPDIRALFASSLSRV